MKFKRQVQNQRLSLIACTNKKNALGKDGELLYRMKKDFQWFQYITSGQIVIMGVKTYLEIGKALPNRLNIVVYDASRPEPEVDDDVILARNISEALMIANFEPDREVFIIGGASLYQEAMTYNVDYIYRTLVYDESDGDVEFIPIEDITKEFKLKNPMMSTFQEQNRVSGENVLFHFEIWEKKIATQAEKAMDWLMKEKKNYYESGEDDEY